MVALARRKGLVDALAKVTKTSPKDAVRNVQPSRSNAPDLQVLRIRQNVYSKRLQHTNTPLEAAIQREQDVLVVKPQ